MANIVKIITDIIEDNTMRLKTQLGKQHQEYYQTKIDVCNQILEKVRRENAQSEKSNCTIPDVIQRSELLLAFVQYLGVDCGVVIFDTAKKIDAFLSKQ